MSLRQNGKILSPGVPINEAIMNGKQDKLTPGDGITIEKDENNNTVISATDSSVSEEDIMKIRILWDLLAIKN